MDSQITRTKECPKCGETLELVFYVAIITNSAAEVAECVGCRVFKSVVESSIPNESGFEVGYADESALDERLRKRWEAKLDIWRANAHPTPQHDARGKQN